MSTQPAKPQPKQSPLRPQPKNVPLKRDSPSKGGGRPPTRK